MTSPYLAKEPNSTPRFLITGDPTKTMQPEFDTTLLMCHELLKRGYDVDYCDLFQTNLDQEPEAYLKNLKVQKVLFADNDDPCFIGLAPAESKNVLDEYDIVIHRKDPPVDAFFEKKCKIFATLPKSILQINNPEKIATLHEHEIPLRYPDFCAKTYVCQSYEEFVEAVRACPTEAVCKPHIECSGLGIEFYKNDVDENILKAYWRKRQPRVIVQPFIKEIENSGDLRVLMMNGAILGSVLRVPKKGSRLANLHQGAHGEAYEITDFHRNCAKVVSEDLAKEGIYLIGLDFIGENLTEVNITSPTALPLINRLMNIQGHLTLVDEIENLYKENFERDHNIQREIPGN